MLRGGPGGERTRHPGRARPGRRGRDALPHRDGEADPRRGRRRGACAATQARSRRSSASQAEVRGVESIGAGGDPAELAREAARALGVVASVDGPGRPRLRRRARRRDRERRPAARVDHRAPGCMSSAITGCFLAVAESPFDGAVEALVAFGVAGEDAARRGAKGPGSFHVDALRRARRARPGDARRARAKSREGARDRRGSGDGAPCGRGGRDGRAASRQGADRRGRRARPRLPASSARPSSSTTMSRRRSSSAPTASISARPTLAPSAREPRACCSAGRRRASSRRSTADADYLGVGPIWETPSKADAEPPIGLDELARDLRAPSRSR